jgi:hypothetical protein
MHSDYVSIVCGCLDKLPQAFARLDSKTRTKAQSSVPTIAKDAETASLSTADRKLVRTQEMTDRIIEAAQMGSLKKKVA